MHCRWPPSSDVTSRRYKLWLAARPGKSGKASWRRCTIRQSTRNICAPSSSGCATGTTTTRQRRTLIFPGDFPQADEPLPKFLDDPTMEKFTAALASDPDPRRRVMVEILAQTGIRVGELSGLDDKAVTMLGDTMSLRIPIGKLHNDRYVPIGDRTGAAHRRLSEGSEDRAALDACSNVTTANPSTDAPSIATSSGWPSGLASATSIPISSVTRLPPG